MSQEINSMVVLVYILRTTLCLKLYEFICQHQIQAVGLGSSSVYTSGSTQYGRVKITLSNGVEETLRVSMPTGSSSNVTSITAALTAVTGSSTTPSNYPYGLEWDGSNHYIWMNLEAYSSSTLLYTESNYRLLCSNIISTAYNLGYQQGYAAGGGSSVTVRSVKALSNKTYDQSMDMYYVKVRVTYTNGTTQDFNAWYD